MWERYCTGADALVCVLTILLFCRRLFSLFLLLMLAFIVVTVPRAAATQPRGMFSSQPATKPNVRLVQAEHER